jgi:type II secretory pathway component GspD/PulD (secretin)
MKHTARQIALLVALASALVVQAEPAHERVSEALGSRQYDVGSRFYGLVNQIIGPPADGSVGDFLPLDSVHMGPVTEADIQKLLGLYRVTWPDGASVKYVPHIGKLLVSNTGANHDRIARALVALDVTPVQIEIEVLFVSFSAADIERLAITGITVDSLIALWKAGGGKFLTAPRIVTQSGQQATIKGVTEFIYPTEFETEGIRSSFPRATHGAVGSVVTPSPFETREVGTILEVLPEVSPNGKIINITLSPELVDEPVWKDFGSTHMDATGTPRKRERLQPFFHTYHFRTSVLVEPGRRLLIGGGTETQDGTRVVYAFLTARLLDVYGREIKMGEE